MPPDEGLELIDGDGKDLDVDYSEDLGDHGQENEGGTMEMNSASITKTPIQ